MKIKYSQDFQTQKIMRESESKQDGLLDGFISQLGTILTPQEQASADLTLSLSAKPPSSNVGFVAKIESHESIIKKFYVKYDSHTSYQNEAEKINQTAIIEAFVYKILEKMGIGAKFHFFAFKSYKDAMVGMVSEDMTRQKGDKEKQYHIAVQREFRNLLKQIEPQQKEEYMVGILIGSITSQILAMYDINSITNIGSIFTLDEAKKVEKSKPKIIDFLVGHHSIKDAEKPLNKEAVTRNLYVKGFVTNMSIDATPFSEEIFDKAKEIVFNGRLTAGGKQRLSIENAANESFSEVKDFLQKSDVKISGSDSCVMTLEKYHEDVRGRIAEIQDFFGKESEAKAVVKIQSASAVASNNNSIPPFHH